MAAPKRPSAKRRGARGASPKGLPSSEHSDASAIVSSIIETSATTDESETAGEDQAPGPAGDSARSTVTTIGLANDTATWAPLEQLAHRPDNPRAAHEYDQDDPELAAMLRTFEQYDVLQPVTVVTRQAWLEYHPQHSDVFDEQAQWVVVMGNRRLAGARHARLAGLPIHRNDALARGLAGREAGIIENYHRKPLDPVREAAEMFSILEETGESRREFAERMGISHTQVLHRLRLLSLIPEFQGMVSDHVLTVQKALPLTELSEIKQQALLKIGEPYVPARLDAPEQAAQPHALAIAKPVTLRRNSTPTDIVDTLRKKLTPELLYEIKRLLAEDRETPSSD